MQRWLFWLLVYLIGVLFPGQAAGLVMRTETFDTDPGWTGVRNVDVGLGNNYGFSNTDNTGGLSTEGEAGGTIARTTLVSYYADTMLGGFRASFR